MCKVIGVISLKGGVGKTSSVIALGYAFSRMGKKVLLIDGNLSAPNLGWHLNIIEPKKSLHDVLQRDINPRDAIYNLENFDIITSRIFNDGDIEYLSLKKKISALKNKYDVIIIDSSPKLDDETLAVILASDELIVITTPDLPTLGNTIQAVKLAKKRGTPISGIVLNKVYNKNFELSIKDVETTLGLPIMAVIPYDINFLRALSEFKPLTEHRPKSEASEEYMNLAGTLIGEKYRPIKIRTFFRWVSPRRQDINRTIFYENIFK
jgi:septum site-determining protein MinD